MANPAHKPTDESRDTVTAMASYGIPHEDIASVVGIDAKTLRKHYRQELDTAATIANSKIAKTLYDKATNDKDTTALIWWTKARMRWSERHEHTGADGGPIKTSNFDLKQLDKEDRDAIRAILAKRASESK
jgi:hypothetical protein